MLYILQIVCVPKRLAICFLVLATCGRAFSQAAEDPTAITEAPVKPDAISVALSDDPQQSRSGDTSTQESKQQSANSQADSQARPKEAPAEPEAHGTRLRWQDLPKNILHDEKAIFTSPLHINRQNAKWWILLGSSTAALIATDRTVSDALPNQGFAHGASTWTSRLGADYSIYPMAASFYLAGKLGDNPRARDTARIGIEALADAEITVNVLKTITQRPRPEYQGASVAFFSGGDAWPSGHSIKSWALARVVAREFPHPVIIPIVAYGLAATVGVARFGGRRHSPGDVFAGSAMGFFIGDYVYRRHHAPSQRSSALPWLASHVSVGFSMGP
jgi:membrane-associated phospholipid phosphatase